MPLIVAERKAGSRAEQKEMQPLERPHLASHAIRIARVHKLKEAVSKQSTKLKMVYLRTPMQ